jgi:nucleotide-binding universal stress UspA family protein
MRDAKQSLMLRTNHRIVVALDLEQYSEIVLEHALDQAARHRTPDLHFLTVVERPAECVEMKKRLAQLVLPALQAIDRATWTVHLHVRAGDAPKEIAALALEVGAHLIVIGRFGTHHPHRHIAKMASDILDLAPCPVLVAGLSGDDSHASPQCDDCAKMRAETGGEKWFCVRHSGDRARMTALVPFGSSWTGSNELW